MRRYTPEEKEVIRRDYARLGPKVLAKRLKRSRFSLFEFARQNDLTFVDGYDSNSRMLVADFVRVTGINRNTVYFAAKRDGVLRNRGAGSIPYSKTIPIAWADKYLEEHEGRTRADEELGDQWYRSAKVAEIFGVETGYLRNLLRGKHPNSAYWQALKHVERRRAKPNRWLWNPYQVEEAWRKYRETTN